MFFRRCSAVDLSNDFQAPPSSLNGVALTVIRRIIDQAEIDPIFLSELDQPFHELGSATVVFGTIVGFWDRLIYLENWYRLSCRL